jgi:hypothetical protein
MPATGEGWAIQHTIAGRVPRSTPPDVLVHISRHLTNPSSGRPASDHRCVHVHQLARRSRARSEPAREVSPLTMLHESNIDPCGEPVQEIDQTSIRHLVGATSDPDGLS